MVTSRTAKLWVIVIGLIVSTCLLAAIWFTYDPTTTIVRNNGVALVEAINQYQQETGHYPGTLQELVPKYVAGINAPVDSYGFGWLYLPTEQDFTLGYVDNVGKFGYWICVIHSVNKTWDCLLDSDTPFVLPPTPFPTPATSPVH